MTDPLNDPVLITKEMGITHRDFFRIIGNALGSDAYESTESGVRLQTGSRLLDITLGPEGERRIALMVIPRTLVTLSFSHYSAPDIEAAIKRFDMMFKKGGG